MAAHTNNYNGGTYCIWLNYQGVMLCRGKLHTNWKEHYSVCKAIWLSKSTPYRFNFIMTPQVHVNLKYTE